ncbi:hypothetical protein KJ059_02465 [Myxococcota bacterium]|nr:hypothetical protein [Myxococcota bacterium]MCZ7619801.1 hypothetical protein [Myxococcota bacterium]
MTRSIRSLLACTLLLSVSALPAQAGKPAHAGGKGAKGNSPHGDPHRSRDPRDDRDVEIRFSTHVRREVYDWYEETYGRGHCPPGLAKKLNGCLPPGLAKKRYRIGSRLPSGVLWHPLPGNLARRVGAPPHGYQYGIVDGDVVQLAIGSLLVADALDGLLD